MARVLCIDDYPLYAEMVGAMLRSHGHTVQTAIVPLDLDAALEFDPQVILLNLVRKAEALGRAIARFEDDVDGAQAMLALARHARAARLPLIVTALAVDAAALPPELRHDAFLTIPGELPRLLVEIERVTAVRDPF